MTVLSVARQVATYLGRDIPTTVYGSAEREDLELAEILQEAAQEIYKAYDWEALKTLNTYNGDGANEVFALPADYGRFPKDMKIWSSRIETPLTHIVSQDRWLELQIRSYEFVIGVWTKFGGNIYIRPAMVVGETAQFFYISKNVVEDLSNVRKAVFTQDDDTFLLNERILKLCAIWKWKASKNLPYDEDMKTYQMALEECVAEDKGAQTPIRIGRGRIRKGINISYPQAVVT